MRSMAQTYTVHNKNFPTTLVGKKQRDQTYIFWSQIHAQHGININKTRTFQQPLVGQKQRDQTYKLVTNPCTA